MTIAPIFTRAGFEPFVLSLRGATLVHQCRDNSVAKVGGKIFALLDRDQGEVWLKVSQMAFDLLPDLPFIRPAPYFARASWVAVGAASPLDEAEVKSYIVEAHRLVATKLPQKTRVALALDTVIAAAPHRP